MTELLKHILHRYGLLLLYITITKLQGDRLGTLHESLEEYDESLGPLQEDEPVVIVRVSPDGEHRIVAGSTSSDLEPRHGAGEVTIMELPDDEFYFFQAFRPGMFDLEKQLPPFLFEMALVYAYTLFESYLSHVVKRRYRAYPALAGLRKQVTLSEILASPSKDSLLEAVIELEANRLLYEPIEGILEAFRMRLGFRTLTTEFDQEVQILSLTRNCLIHNGSNADYKLAALKPSLTVGQPIKTSLASVSDAIQTCRKFCAAIDTALEALETQVAG